MRFRFVRSLIALLLMLFANHSRSAGAGDEHWDVRFGLAGIYEGVFALLETNGNIYAGGISFFDGTTNTQVRIWNGTNWAGLPKLTAGLALITDLALYKGELYVGGQFRIPGGPTNLGLARWDGFGWREVGGFNGFVTALRVVGEDLYVGGSFTNIGSLPTRHIARWDGGV